MEKLCSSHLELYPPLGSRLTLPPGSPFFSLGSVLFLVSFPDSSSFVNLLNVASFRGFPVILIQQMSSTLAVHDNYSWNKTTTKPANAQIPTLTY